MSTLTKDQLKARIAARTKSASASVPADPLEKGNPSIPTDPKNTKEHQNLPKDNKNQSLEGTKLEDQDTHPSRTGKNVPATQDGEAHDKKPVKSASVAERLQAIKAKVTGVTPSAPTTKSASPVNEIEDTPIQFDQEAMLKLAAAILETEEGIDLVTPYLNRKAGRDATLSMIKEASDAYNTALEQAYMQEAYEAQLYQAAEQEEFAKRAFVEHVFQNASNEEEAYNMIKAAHVHAVNRDAFETEFEKLAYDQGVDDAAAMMAAEEGGAEPSLEGAEAPTLEQILMLLDAAVQSGEIDEETAAALAEELMADPEMGGGEMLPPEGGEEEMVHSASADPVAASRNLFATIKSASAK
jgi:hypothetical protein